jgi:hypothetical protein
MIGNERLQSKQNKTKLLSFGNNYVFQAYLVSELLADSLSHHSNNSCFLFSNLYKKHAYIIVTFFGTEVFLVEIVYS